MGSNMAECHPVAFRWVMKAKTREQNPCTLIHADPRFTRTSALANIYAPLRAGSDIVFLGALIGHVIGEYEQILARPGQPQPAPDPQSFTAAVGGLVGPHPRQDITLRHERCVYQILKKHFQRYTPLMVEQVCGTAQATFTAV